MVSMQYGRVLRRVFSPLLHSSHSFSYVFLCLCVADFKRDKGDVNEHKIWFLMFVLTPHRLVLIPYFH